MHNKYGYRGVIENQRKILRDFEIRDTLNGIKELLEVLKAMIQEYPQAQAKVIDAKTGQVIYRLAFNMSK